jgi:aryl sulfotransferase
MNRATLLNAWNESPSTVQNHSLDSTRWSELRHRAGDIVLASWGKTGTTWVQQILGQLIFSGAEGIPVMDISPWVENRLTPWAHVLSILERQEHRRFMKTHLPAHALPFSSHVRYIYVGRDGRDAAWSWYHHHKRMTPLAYSCLRGLPERFGPLLEPPDKDPREYFLDWLDRDGYPLWPFWEHVKSWWEIRLKSNVLFVHFNDLKADLAGQIRRIAAFLSIDVVEQEFERIIEHCTFSYMKDRATSLSRVMQFVIQGGAMAFINKGENRQWSDVLTADDIRLYEAHVAAKLPSDCGVWLRNGGLVMR